MKFVLLIAFFLVAHSAFAQTLADLARQGINIRFDKIQHARLQSLSEPEDHYLLDVKLGKLTDAQFRAVKLQLPTSPSLIHDANKNYNLIDFLPPFAQATVNHVLEPRNFNTEPIAPLLDKPEFAESMTMWFMKKNGLSHFTNCWNTTIELLRSLNRSWDNTVYLYWPGRWSADEQLKATEHSTKIAAKDARHGDVILFSMLINDETGSGMLQHTVWMVSKDVVFEKIDGTENDPYRLALLSDVMAKYRRIISDGQKLKIEYRRFNKAILPAPGSAAMEPNELKALKKIFSWMTNENVTVGCETGLGGGCDQVFSVIHKASLSKDLVSGRAVLVAPNDVKNRFINLQ